jgi:hypothetical protein
MLSNLIAAVGVTAIAALIFLVYIHVIWCLSDCAVSDSFSKSTKIGWVIFLSLSGCFGAFLYSFFATPSRVLRGVTIFAFIALAIGIPALFVYGMLNPTQSTSTTSAATSPHTVKHSGKHAPKHAPSLETDDDDN